MSKTNKFLLHISIIAGISSCFAVSDENIKNLLQEHHPVFQEQRSSYTIQVTNVNQYVVELSRSLPNGINPYVVKKNEDGSFEAIWGNEYPAGCIMDNENNRIIYPNGNWKNMQYFTDFMSDTYYMTDDSEICYDKEPKHTDLGRILKENRYVECYEDGSWVYKDSLKRVYPDGSVREASGLTWLEEPKDPNDGNPLQPGQTCEGTTMHSDGSWTTPDGKTHRLGGKD